MKFKWKKFPQIIGLFLGYSVLLVTMTVIAVMAAYQLAYAKMILPKISVSGVELSNTDKETALKRLRTEFEAKPNMTRVIYQGKEVANLEGLSVNYDYDWAIKQAWSIGRSGNPLTRIAERINIFMEPRTIKVPIAFSSDDLDGILMRISEKIDHVGKGAKIIVNDKGEVSFQPGEDGLQVDASDLRSKITEALSMPGEQQVSVITKVISYSATNDKIDQALTIARGWKGKQLTLRYKDFNLIVSTNDVIQLIGLGTQPLNSDGVKTIEDKIKQAIEVEPKNAVLAFDGGKVKEFQPEVNGIKLVADKFETNLAAAIQNQKTDLEIPVEVTKPEVAVSDINNLGIKEKIGTGTSKFHGSIPNRIHNLSLASSRLNGALVKPGETFSLNQTIGDVSAATGYEQAYIIQEGRTVLGDGGGVCQVSTTLFRALLNAGLPITERKAHAYRVHYYEEDMGPGFDSTVFAPSADLKFVNDTPGYILITTSVDPKTFSMHYDLYGTSDGRVASISAARIYSQTPPPATVYQDDPTMKVGQMKQVDWSAWGAKVAFDYKVVKNGQTTIDKTFTSVYQPWAAVYLKGIASN